MTRHLKWGQRGLSNKLNEIARAGKGVVLIDSTQPDKLKVFSGGEFIYSCCPSSQQFGYFYAIQGKNYRPVFIRDIEDVRDMGKEFVVKINSQQRRIKRN